MPNTKSSEKAVRSSLRKNAHNSMWEKRVKDAAKSLTRSIEAQDEEKILIEKLTILQKVADKAAKEKVIHKNKANRLKSKYAHKVSALSKTPAKPRHKVGTKGESKTGSKREPKATAEK